MSGVRGYLSQQLVDRTHELKAHFGEWKAQAPAVVVYEVHSGCLQGESVDR